MLSGFVFLREGYIFSTYQTASRIALAAVLSGASILLFESGITTIRLRPRVVLGVVALGLGFIGSGTTIDEALNDNAPEITHSILLVVALGTGLWAFWPHWLPLLTRRSACASAAASTPLEDRWSVWDRRIAFGGTAALLFGAYALSIGLVLMSADWEDMDYLSLGMFVGGAITIGFAFGIYRKSRKAMLCLIIPILWSRFERGIKVMEVAPLLVTALYFYGGACYAIFRQFHASVQLSSPPPAFNWRPFKWVGLSLAAIMLGISGGILFRNHGLSKQIQARIAEIQAQGLPTDLLELDLWYPDVPPEENATSVLTNAFPYLLKKSEESERESSLGEKALPQLGRRQTPELGRLVAESLEQTRTRLKAARDALQILDEGSKPGRARYPIDLTDGYNTPLPHLTALKRGSLLLRQRAMVLAMDRQHIEAIETVHTILRLADSLSQEPLSVSQLVRLSMKRTACSTLELILNLAALEDGQIKGLLSSLENLEDSAGMRRAIAGERAMCLNLFLDSAEGFVSVIEQAKDSVDPESIMTWRVLRGFGGLQYDCLFFLNMVQKYSEAANSPYPERLKLAEEVARRVEEAKATRKTFLSRPVVSAMFLPAVARAITNHAEAVAVFRNTSASLAVERFRLKYGRMPESLDETVPGFLDQAPLDPFDGKPLRYKRLNPGYMIYSVGPDRKDNGGVTPQIPGRSLRSTAQKPLDITFTVKR
ncbi:MAG: hypothetical protein HYY23_14245 [Verrucomicrobia bacterium]|nr:hypothetical protein [Verrucomicrobiota bacterium]